MAKYELHGRTAIVTGAGAGIGEACAHVLSSSGAAVLVVDLDKERAENVANSISNDGGPALSHVADVSNLDDVEAMVARAEEELGPCASPSTTLASGEHLSRPASTTWTPGVE